MGLRFRVHYRPLPGSRGEADIAFTRLRLVVLIDGCFWHGCPVHATSPQRNETWWAEKLRSNVGRDRRFEAALAKAGWRVVRCWEHQGTDEIVRAVTCAVRTPTMDLCLDHPASTAITWA
jgi:DNA mismatch endonuclease, patch repair protein